MPDPKASFVAVVEPHQDRIVLDGMYYSVDQVRFALKRHLETEKVHDAMTERKTNDIVSRGYEKVGYVLVHPVTGEYCLSAGGAVCWLKKPEYQWIMHNRDHVRFEWPAPIGER